MKRICLLAAVLPLVSLAACAASVTTFDKTDSDGNHWIMYREMKWLNGDQNWIKALETRSNTVCPNGWTHSGALHEQEVLPEGGLNIRHSWIIRCYNR